MTDISVDLKAAFAEEAVPQQSDFWRLIDLADRARNAVGANPANPGLGPGLSLDDKGVVQIDDFTWSRLLHGDFFAKLNATDSNLLPGEMNVIFELLQSASKGAVSNALWPATNSSPGDGDVAPVPRGASAGKLRNYFSAGQLPRAAAYDVLIDTVCQAAKALGVFGAVNDTGRGITIYASNISLDGGVKTFSYNDIYSINDDDKAWLFYNIFSSSSAISNSIIE